VEKKISVAIFLSRDEILTETAPMQLELWEYVVCGVIGLLIAMLVISIPGWLHHRNCKECNGLAARAQSPMQGFKTEKLGNFS
jgi:hypothetical protein